MKKQKQKKNNLFPSKVLKFLKETPQPGTLCRCFLVFFYFLNISYYYRIYLKIFLTF